MRKFLWFVLSVALLAGCANEYEVNQQTQAVEMPLSPAPKPNPEAVEIEKNLQKQYAEVGVPVIRVGRVVQVRYPSDRFFEVGKAALIPGADNYLLALWQNVKAYPDLQFSVEGLTDNSGNAQKNLVLSGERAEAVAQYLIQLGMPATAIRAKGFGGALPVANNDTLENRALNRLVVVTITVPKAQKSKPGFN